jgi:hypothetical protein
MKYTDSKNEVDLYVKGEDLLPLKVNQLKKANLFLQFH